MADPLNSGETGGRWSAAAASSESGCAPSDRSSLVDAAYAEYCRLRAAGQPVDPDAFCARFPDVKSSLGQILRAHRFLDEHPQLLRRSPPAWPEPGQEFLGFRLLRELGRGSFARVFLASEPALGDRAVAVKIAPWGGAEARTLGRLEHPNVVPVHSVREEPASGLTAVCMPYLGSATLATVLDRAFAPTKEKGKRQKEKENGEIDPPFSFCLLPFSFAYVEGVLHLAAQLADGLAFIHGQGICHRDLKPSNVLLTPDGRPMLLDFNLAADPCAAACRLGGTFPYMAPEQLRAMGALPCPAAVEMDARSDIFSLGVLLYELLTGTHPFDALPLKLDSAALRERLLRRQQAGPRPLRQENQAVDRPLARLIESCLAHDPRDRPQSAVALAGALRACLAPRRRVRRWAGCHRRTTLASALGLLAMLLAVGWLWAFQTPYPLRRLQQGLHAYRQGDYPQAVEHFTDALRADPGLPPALFARGRAYQRLGATDRGNFVLALNDYERANQAAPDGRILACMGYCRNRLGVPRDAILSYDKAIAAGFAPAAVFNNLGCSHLDLSQLSAAREHLDRAIALDPGLPVAYHNRALVFLQLAISAPDSGSGEASRSVQRRFLQQGASDIRRAIALGAAGADVHYDAACLYARLAGSGESLAPALDSIERAVDNGHDPRGLATDQLLRPLWGAARFQALGDTRPRPLAAHRTSRLLDPLHGLAE